MSAARTLLQTRGGSVRLPGMVLLDRADGGHLVIDPPRAVWDRSELSAPELTAFSLLTAATARAMLDALPQLRDGCINYWDAGNWALNRAAEPAGPKTGSKHRKMHLHLLGRSPRSQHPDWQWGESPFFPKFADRLQWASRFAPLNADECAAVIERALQLLKEKYGVGERAKVVRCGSCGYPSAGSCSACEARR